jgi:murein DD-endopeptidase
MGDDALSVAEIFGLAPLRRRLREAALILRGDPTTPKVRYGLSSLRQMTRVPGWRVWAGQRPYGRRVPISNLFNHEQPPPEEGWSVRITRVRDFMGGGLTYDSHNGTDLATPVGTRVLAAAPGVVLRVSSEFNRGGLKVFVDHGDGLVTTSNHLARALVRPGDRVRRGQVIALSGYSGLDGLVTFPWGIPHVHFNVWLDGESVDPFAPPGETPLWRAGNWPTPFGGDEAEARAHAEDQAWTPTAWDDDAVARGLAACRASASRADVEAITDPAQRAMALLFHMNYYPTRFAARPCLYRERHARRPRLDLPFHRDDYDGVVFPGVAGPPLA